MTTAPAGAPYSAVSGQAVGSPFGQATVHRQRSVRRRLLSMGTLLLFGLEGMEHRLLDVGFEGARGGIDERVRSTVLKLRVFLLHVVLRAMVAELHVAGERTHGLERAVELVDQRRA